MLRWMLVLTALAASAVTTSAARSAEDWTGIPILSVTDGSSASLADFRGQVVVLNFWATWCVPCRYEIPALMRLQERFGEHGVVVVGVTAETDAGRVRQYLEKMTARYPVFLDWESRLHRAAHPAAIPTSILLDRSGKPLRWYSGFDRNGGLARIESDLSEYLGQ